MGPVDSEQHPSRRLTPSDLRWWSPGRIATRAVSVWRREGPGGIWDRALAEFGFKRIELLRIDAEGLSASRGADALGADVPIADVPIDALREGEIEAYLQFHPGHSRAEVEARLQGGDVCHCARHDGAIVSAAWTTVRPHLVRYVGREIPIEVDEVYLYDAFTPPVMRSKNLMTSLVRSIARQYGDFGKRHVVMAVRRHNRSMVRVAAKLGARPYAVMSSAPAPGLGKTFVRRNGS